MHSFCVAETVSKIKLADAMVMDDKPICSLSCYHFSLIDGLAQNTVTSEQVALEKKNKEQVKKEARECSVKVNCQVNGVRHDASKEVIVACLLEKRILQHPSLATSLPAEEVVTTSKLTINDKFHLINEIFSEELSDLAIRSEDTSTCTELDAGLVDCKSQFWSIMEMV